MAFKGKLNTQQTSNASEREDAVDFLQPKKDHIKDSMNDPYRAQLIQKNAYQYTMKTLNALKIVSPIISGLMQNPGLDATNTELSNNFKLLITEISNISEKVCEKLEIDPTKEQNFWIRNVLERCFSEIIHYQWVKFGKVDIEPLVELINHVIEKEDVAEKFEYAEISENSLVKLATIKSMIPILKEGLENPLYRNLDDDIEHIMSKLYESSKNSVIKICDDYADQKDKAKLFYLIMQEAGKLYAISWKMEAARVNQIMNDYPPEKLNDVLTKYKESGGLPLTKIENDFDKYFEKMMVITDKLISSSQGNIKKRLNK